jgi:hypothetical protein
LRIDVAQARISFPEVFAEDSDGFDWDDEEDT